MANRIYFANQQVAFKRDATASDGHVGDWLAAHGVQSVAVTTTFNLEQAFELGQLAIYENIEGVPDVEVTLSKVLDGYPLLYHLATQSDQGTQGISAAHDPTLAGRSNEKCIVGLSIFPDTVDSARTNPAQQVSMSGMFCSSVSYNFPLEDNFSEDVTLVGNNKAWNNIGGTDAIGCATPGWVMSTATGQFPSNADAPVGTGGVNRRENLSFAATSAADSAARIDYTLLPTEIPGVDANGWINPAQNGANEAHLQSITVSTDLGREELFELGTRQPYARVVTFPVEVTCDIEVLSISGDMINALADGCNATASCATSYDNLSNQTIRIATCEGTRIFLGDKNKLASVNYGGGDAGGGNVTVTYSYTTFNDFTVLHPQDPDKSGAVWWQHRASFLR